MTLPGHALTGCYEFYLLLRWQALRGFLLKLHRYLTLLGLPLPGFALFTFLNSS